MKRTMLCLISAIIIGQLSYATSMSKPSKKAETAISILPSEFNGTLNENIITPVSVNTNVYISVPQCDLFLVAVVDVISIRSLEMNLCSDAENVKTIPDRAMPDVEDDHPFMSQRDNYKIPFTNRKNSNSYITDQIRQC